MINLAPFSPMAAVKADMIASRYESLQRTCREVNDTPADQFQSSPAVLADVSGQLIKKQPFPDGFSEITVMTLPQDGPAVKEIFLGYEDAASHRDNGSERGNIEYSRITYLPEGESRQTYCYNPQGTLTTLDDSAMSDERFR